MAIGQGNQPLPPKELALFKKLLKCYEQKQYKVGLRCAKQILTNPTFAEHGETLAMKGLILNCMGKHEEAMEIVKRGLTSNLKSHICWHVFGLVQRSDKKYDEAMKAYKMALKIEKDNLQILRDLSLLQIQMRDLEGYRDSRYQLLVLRPANKMSWIGYASAYHLLKDYDTALHIIKEFRKNNRSTSQYDPENSELVLYEVSVLREAGRPEHALTKLEENSSCVLDKVAYHETRAELLMELDRLEDAEKVYWILVDRNPDNRFYYEQIAKCRGALKEKPDPEVVAPIYEAAGKKHSYASVPKLAPLFFLEGEAFEKRLLPYLTNGLRKGVPSLFKNIVPLYSNSTKAAAIERVLLDFVKRLEANGYSKGSLDDSSLPETPTTVLWVYYYLAQHFDRLKQYTTALKYIDRALQHTPTLIELYMTKAKIYKHAGDLVEAANLMDRAQELDTADRYINSKCAKYMLRAGQVQEAEQMCAKFTREGSNATDSLNEMQCMWYELECAYAYVGMGEFGEALKRCHQVERHFVCFYEDQYDFHTYCLRKMTLTFYVGILRFEDVVRRQPYYVAAAKLATSIYLRMIDRPMDFEEKPIEGAENMSAAELRKLKRKANKAKAQEAADKKQASQNKKRIDGELDVVEPEPLDPNKLTKPDNPLEEAAKFILPVLSLDCDDIEAFFAGFELFYRKNKILGMLQCLKKAYTIEPTHPDLHVAATKYLLKYKEAHLEGLPAQLAKELTDSLLSNQDLKSRAAEFRKNLPNSFRYRLAAAEAEILLDANIAREVKPSLLKALEDAKVTDLTLRTCLTFLDRVKYGRLGAWSKDEMSELTKKCNLLHPLANTFGGGANATPARSNNVQ
ncbi:N-alpha-acetyltransferase 15NatA auxiliary subunit isoform 2 [Aphelenchoides avenae]|nr:N-alpha-acetyltransferase 15NatA auxiliary subunit isoform 2 [Aphelenchus avenae]